MTDNEIIKALELVPHCNVYSGECKKCPYRWVDDCATKFPKDALDLINRQKAELTQYAHDQHELMIEKDKLFDIAEKQKAEIGRLKKENAIVFSIPENTQFENLEHFETRQVSKEMLPTIVRRAKAEAITEFEKRLSDTKFRFGNDYVIYADNVSTVAKEMKEGVNNA